jgi:phosphoenolpyruvate synthase/pyruvate phosphate dikinase
MDFFLHPMLDPESGNFLSKSIIPFINNEYTRIKPDVAKVESKLIGKGASASAGLATGRIAFSCAAAEEFHKNKVNCILCRHETSADDIGGLNVRKKTKFLFK